MSFRMLPLTVWFTGIVINLPAIVVAACCFLIPEARPIGVQHPFILWASLKSGRGSGDISFVSTTNDPAPDGASAGRGKRGDIHATALGALAARLYPGRDGK